MSDDLLRDCWRLGCGLTLRRTTQGRRISLWLKPLRDVDQKDFPEKIAQVTDIMVSEDYYLIAGKCRITSYFNCFILL